MSRTLTFSKQAWEEYLYWQSQDKKTLKKINNLLEGGCVLEGLTNKKERDKIGKEGEK